MRINIVGAFVRNAPFATELAFKRGFDRLGVHQMTYIDPSFPLDEWDYDADATIVFKDITGEFHDALENTGGKKIVYQPDDLRFPHIQQMMRQMRYLCPYAFTFDDDGARLAVEYGYLKAQKLLLTADDELYRHIPFMKKDIDFCFVGSMTGGASHMSRRRMVDILTHHGFKVLALADMYNLPSLVNIYNRSKVILNHATDVGQGFGNGYGLQCRHFEAGFTKSCILSNYVPNECALQGTYASFHDEDSLIEMAHFLMREEPVRENYAERLYTALNSAHLPEHRASEMIEFIGTL